MKKYEELSFYNKKEDEKILNIYRTHRLWCLFDYTVNFIAKTFERGYINSFDLMIGLGALHQRFSFYSSGIIPPEVFYREELYSLSRVFLSDDIKECDQKTLYLSWRDSVFALFSKDHTECRTEEELRN